MDVWFIVHKHSNALFNWYFKIQIPYLPFGIGEMVTGVLCRLSSIGVWGLGVWCHRPTPTATPFVSEASWQNII